MEKVTLKYFAVRRILALEIVTVYLLAEIYMLYLTGKEYDITRLAAAAAIAYGGYFAKRYFEDKTKETKTQ